AWVLTSRGICCTVPQIILVTPARRAGTYLSAPRFAERDVMEYWIGTAASVGLDVGRPDHLAPLFGFGRNMLSELGWRIGKHDGPQVDKLRFDFRVGERGVGFLVELLDDVPRSVLGRTKTLPPAGLIPRHELANRRNIRQRLRARGGGYCERAQPASPDILNRCDSAGEVALPLPGDEIGDRRPATAIGHVDHVDAGHHLEKLAGQMSPGADARRRHA